ncbi:hypothetical protein [Gordonia malaquae]|uniref:hypothetical protein n=1 Tax=Gordonia malaquae TaxID=410332 RepID=UPI003019F31B
MNTIKFVDNLPSVGGYRYLDFFDALRGSPGRWAEFPTQRRSSSAASNLARSVRKGQYGGTEDGEFHAVVRQGVVYVKYDPEAVSA